MRNARPITRSFISGALAGSILAAFSVSLAHAEVQQFNGPNFRQGMWHFVHMLYRIPQSSREPLIKEEMTRCVDPTIAMKDTFSSPNVGACHSTTPQKMGNRYYFPMRCDFMGPVATEITVENDSAYTEVNALTIGSFPREDKVVARRIGDCGKTEQ